MFCMVIFLTKWINYISEGHILVLLAHIVGSREINGSKYMRSMFHIHSHEPCTKYMLVCAKKLTYFCLCLVDLEKILLLKQQFGSQELSAKS